MAILSKITLFLLVFSFFGATPVFADDLSLEETVRQLQKRVEALENKLGEQDKCMKEQKTCILDQNKKIAEYESRLAQFDTDLHRQTGVPISIAEGLEISAGGTMVAQGTNNTNNANADITRKEGRADAS